MACTLLSRIATMVIVLALIQPLWAAPPIALPPDIVVANRGQAMNLNGLPFDTYALRSLSSPAALEAAIDSLWRNVDAGLPIVHRQVGEWVVISRRSAGWLHTVQWRADTTGGSSGFLSTINLERQPIERAVPLIAMPASVRVRSFVQTREPGATDTQFIATSPMSPGLLLRSVEQTARRTHWAIESAGAADRGMVIALQRGAVQLDLIAAPDPAGSSLVINQHESGSMR